MTKQERKEFRLYLRYCRAQARLSWWLAHAFRVKDYNDYNERLEVGLDILSEIYDDKARKKGLTESGE